MEVLREFVLKFRMVVRNGKWRDGGAGSSLVLCITIEFLRECVLNLIRWIEMANGRKEIKLVYYCEKMVGNKGCR